MSIALRIKQVRQEFDLTQNKFAERIAISTSYLAGMETGDKKVNERIVRLISAEFGINEHWLLTGEGTMHNDLVESSEAKIASMFRMLSPKYQEFALIQINALVDLYKSTLNI